MLKVHMTLHLFLVPPGAHTFLAKTYYSIWTEQGVNLFWEPILAFSPTQSLIKKTRKYIHAI